MAFYPKRIYDGPSEQDGMRILVDRIWPRGVAKHEAKLDEWLKDIAPSRELRTWFGHDAAKWAEFKRRYFKELADNPASVERLRRCGRRRRVTLLFGAKDTEHNNAVALAEYLRHH